MNFDNRTPTGQWQWLGKGLADMVITDLSASSRLTVVERERLNEILSELKLADAGLVDSSAAGRVGRVAKVEWVLFGSYLIKDEAIKIEAHLLDLKTQKLLRVEWVEGAAKEVLKLEKRLVQKLLKRLDVPLTEDERRSIMYVPTDSLSAFEHHARSLDLYDRGKWFDALLECRLAVRIDTNYMKARARVAHLYHEIHQPDHALVEYRALVEADEDNTFPEHIYFRMARLLEEKFRDSRGALILYNKILSRHRRLDGVFDKSGKPLEPAPRIEVAADNPRYSLGSLDRVAFYAEKSGDKVEAARRYWQIYTIMEQNKLREGILADLRERASENFRRLYIKLVEENRDSIFFPAKTIFGVVSSGAKPSKKVLLIPLEGGQYDEKTLANHYLYSYSKYQNQLAFLAPPDKELDRISVTVNTDTAKKIKYGFIQIDFQRNWKAHKKVKIRQGIQTVEHKMSPGTRYTNLFIFGEDTHPSIKVTLRPWAGIEAFEAGKPDTGRLSVRVYPEPAKRIYLDNWEMTRWDGKPRQTGFDGDRPLGKHTIEALWPDGSRQLKHFIIRKGETTRIFLSRSLDILAEHKVDDKGSNTNLFRDKRGTIWLLWDHAGLDGDLYPNRQPNDASDLYSSTSTDGATWSKPRRLPLSSSEMDMYPILQQDGRGVYWLVWSSNRDPESPRWLWIASSRDGVKWTFPRKVTVPTDESITPGLKRQLVLSHFGFTIDNEGTFWLLWQRRLFKSDDAKKWIEVPSPPKPRDGKTRLGNASFLSHDYANRLLMVVARYKTVKRNDGSGKTKTLDSQVLMRRSADGAWKDLGEISGDSFYRACISSVGDRYVAGYSINKGIFLRQFDGQKGWLEACPIESYISKPGFASVAALPDGRIVVAYSCKDGVIVKLCRLSGSAPAKVPGTAVARTDETDKTSPEPAVSRTGDGKATVYCIAPLANNTGDGRFDALGEGFADMLIAALGERPGVKVVERRRLNDILAEQKISLVGLADPATAVKVGKLLKADRIFIGGITRPAGRLTVNLHAYEIATARLVASAQAQTDAADIIPLAKKITDKISRDLNVKLKPINPADIDKNPDATLHFIRGLGFYYSADYDRAIVEFMKSVHYNPVHTKARLWTGKVYIQTEAYAHAEIELRKIVENFRNSEESPLAEKLRKQCQEYIKAGKTRRDK